MLTIKSYEPAAAAAWDELVARSRNGNLLHRRGYMDYHADRFEDCSLLVMSGDKVVAVLPASRHQDLVSSHGGLTYGGLISSEALRAEAALALFEQIGGHYRALGARRMLYKAIPAAFHRYPAEEDLYALHRLGARLARRDIASVLPLGRSPRFTAGRRQSVAKAARAGIRCGIGDELGDFHALLAGALRRHDAVPTHSLEELRLLRGRFPREIVLHEARREGELLAGVLIYDFGEVVHTQYMATSPQGRRLDALSLLLAGLIEDVYAHRGRLSFGISTEREGQRLNAGLIAQKEYFGARAVVHDFYEWTL